MGFTGKLFGSQIVIGCYDDTLKYTSIEFEEEIEVVC